MFIKPARERLQLPGLQALMHSTILRKFLAKSVFLRV
jgi:hypothetical protein